MCKEREMKKVIFLCLSVFWACHSHALDWESSPNNWNNNPNNWENSKYNWNNNPNNWDNSPLNYGNERIIRDNSGNPKGYIVPKSDGGINYFDLDGNRKGYSPPR
jgi:hypothetical protein